MEVQSENKNEIGERSKPKQTLLKFARHRPIETSVATLALGIASVLFWDLGLYGHDLHPFFAWVRIASMVASLSTGFITVCILIVGGFFALEHSSRNIHGFLAYFAVFGIVVVLFQLRSEAAFRSAYLQTIATVLAGAYIAIAIRHKDMPSPRPTKDISGDANNP